MTIPDADSRESQRARRTDSRDVRTERTRAAIREAAETLVRDDNAEVTVAAIVARAGIGRSSFYAHYSSVTDLAEALMVEGFEQLARDEERALEGSPRAAILRTSLLAQFTHLAERRALYRTVLLLPGVEGAHRRVVAQLESIIERRLDQLAPVPRDVRRDTTAKWIAGGLFSVYNAWIAEEGNATADELTNSVLRLLPPWFQDN